MTDAGDWGKERRYRWRRRTELTGETDNKLSVSPVEIILDNAKYHHAKIHEGWRNKSSKRFALNFLPPYSPELNPVERVWKLVRRLATHNKYFSDLNDLAATVERRFSEWSTGSDVLRRLCAIT